MNFKDLKYFLLSIFLVGVVSGIAIAYFYTVNQIDNMAAEVAEKIIQLNSAEHVVECEQSR